MCGVLDAPSLPCLGHVKSNGGTGSQAKQIKVHTESNTVVANKVNCV